MPNVNAESTRGGGLMEVTFEEAGRLPRRSRLTRDYFTSHGVAERLRSGVWPTRRTAGGPMRFGRQSAPPGAEVAWLAVATDPLDARVSRDAGAIWFDGSEWLVVRLGNPLQYRERGRSWVLLPRDEPVPVRRDAVLRFPGDAAQIVLAPEPGEVLPVLRPVPPATRSVGSVDVVSLVLTARQRQALALRAAQQLAWPPALGDGPLTLTEVKVVARLMGTTRQNVEALLGAVRAAATAAFCPSAGTPDEDGYLVSWLVDEGCLDPLDAELQMQPGRPPRPAAPSGTLTSTGGGSRR